MNELLVNNDIILPTINRVGNSEYNWDVLKKLFSVRKLDAQGFRVSQEASFLSLLNPELSTFRAVCEGERYFSFVHLLYSVDISPLTLSTEHLLQLELYLKNSGSVVERATDSLFLIGGDLSKLKTTIVYLCIPASRNVYLDFLLRYIGNWLVYDFTKLKLENIFQDYTRIPYSDGTFFLKSNCYEISNYC